MDSAAAHHEAIGILLANMLLFFAISGLVVPLFQRIHVSPVLGFLLCGLIVGPYGLGLWTKELAWLDHITINDIYTVQILGELGVIAMLFMIGLELSFERLRDLRRYVLGLGSLQILLSTLVIFALAFAFGNSLSAALLLGASLALSSTAIVMQLLDERNLWKREVGILSFSILLMQDLAVVPIVVLASVFASSGDSNVLWLIFEAIFIAVVAVSIVYVVGRLVIRPLLRIANISRHKEWLAAFTLFIILACSVVTHGAGLSAALGAFLAGLLLAETDSVKAIESIISPLKGLLLGIFFLSIGMMIDLREVWANPFWIFVSIVGIVMVKLVVLYPLCRWFKVSIRRSTEVAIMLAQPGEFAFLILSLAMASNMMPREDAQFFLLVTALTMFLTPLLFKLAPVASKWVERKLQKMDDVL